MGEWMRYKRLFLDGYDYFITVVTYERNPILIENIDLLRESFRYAKSRFVFDIDAIVVLPDHFHTIIRVENAEDYPKIISSVKRYFSKKCHPKFYEHLIQSQSRIDQKYKPVWQKRFYEHTIRNEKEYKRRLDYIHYNPVKHGYVDVVDQWAYSSFSKFVRNGVYDQNWADGDTDAEWE
jgi:putative transposase